MATQAPTRESRGRLTSEPAACRASSSSASRTRPATIVARSGTATSAAGEPDPRASRPTVSSSSVSRVADQSPGGSRQKSTASTPTAATQRVARAYTDRECPGPSAAPRPARIPPTMSAMTMPRWIRKIRFQTGTLPGDQYRSTATARTPARRRAASPPQPATGAGALEASQSSITPSAAQARVTHCRSRARGMAMVRKVHPTPSSASTGRGSSGTRLA